MHDSYVTVLCINVTSVTVMYVSPSCVSLPHVTIGKYKIDPNLGCDGDALKAECKKETQCSCMGCDFVVSLHDQWACLPGMY